MGLLIFTSLGLTFVYNPVNAQGNYQVVLDINEDLSGSGNITFDVRNDNSEAFIDGYEFAIPFKFVSDVSIYVDNVYREFTEKRVNDYTILEIDFGDRVLRTGESVNVIVNFTSRELVVTQFGIKQLFIPSLSKNFENSINYSLIYPSSFGDPVYLSFDNPTYENVGSKTRASFAANEGIFMKWSGDNKFAVNVDLKLSNDSEGSRQTLINLPYQSSNQKISYIDFTGGEMGLSDMLRNNFVSFDIGPKSEKRFKYKANVELSKESSILNQDLIYPWSLDRSSAFGEELYKVLASKTSEYDIAYSLNNYLVEKSLPTQSVKVDRANIDKLWEKLKGNFRINSFEYCYIALAAAKEFGIKGELNYGYLLIPFANNLDTTLPHAWCHLYVDDKSLLLDPYLEDLTGIRFFGKDSVDRISFGIWHPELEHNSALGILSEDRDYLIKLGLTDFENKSDNSGVYWSVDAPDTVISGSLFESDHSIFNTTNKFLIVDSLRYNDTQMLDRISFDGGLVRAFLPFSESSFTLRNLREGNLLYDATKNAKFTIAFYGNDIAELEESTEIKFVPDGRIFISLFIAIALAIGFCLWLLYKVRRRYRYF